MIKERKWNLWHPDDFRAEYQELLDRVDSIMQANRYQDFHVFVGTVPLVTIAPITKGVGPTTVINVEPDYSDAKRKCVYYKYYTYFFRDEQAVMNTDRAYLTLSDALYIDDCIRQYNRTIRDLIDAKNHQYRQPRYHLVDISQALQKLAFKRNTGHVEYQFPPYFNHLYPGVDTKYYHADVQGRLRQGGLFSLDGIHPSAICQGLIAYEFLKVMQAAGVTGNLNENYNLDWPSIFKSDSLYQSPIPIMAELYQNDKLKEHFINLICKGSSAQKRSKDISL